jgi:hypothetical protein
MSPAQSHSAGRVFRDLRATVHDFPFRHESHGADLPHVLRYDRGPDLAATPRLQLERGRLGWAISRYFGIAVETGVVMVLYLHEALDHKLASGHQLTKAEIEAAAMEGALQRLRPKLMTVTAVLASLIPILSESGIGSDVMRPIAAPIVGGMITSTIHVLILVPVFFVLMKEGALRRGTLRKEQLKQ